MKKIIIILLTLIYISALNADMPGWTLEEAKANFEGSLKLNQILNDGILQSTIEFSQEEYNVGDVIDITIHFEVNIAKNVEKHKFAIADFINHYLYLFYERHFESLTQNDVDNMHSSIKSEDNVCEFIESDPDLLLSNDNPKGTYHLKFKLTKQTYGSYYQEKQYAYICKIINIYSFTNKKEYKYITKYYGDAQGLNIPIKIHSDALDKSKPKPKIRKLPTENQKRLNSRIENFE